MKTNFLFAAALVGLLQACSGGNSYPDNPNDKKDNMMYGTDNKASATMSKSDMDFAKEAAMGGMTEVELGQLAVDKGTDPKVKQFGERMVTEHGKANDELKGIASSKNIDLPTSLDDDHRDKKEQLDKKSGSDFDHAYVDAMVKDHKEDLKLFQDEADNATDPDLKAFASKSAVMIQTHLTLIQQIQEGMK